MQAARIRHFDLPTGEVELIAVDESPQRFAPARPLAGERTVTQRGRMRLPVRADEQARQGAFNLRDAAQGFRVPRGDLIPDSPNVFPALVAYTVKKGILQIVGFVAVPAVANVHHVARLQPFVLAEHGDEGILPVTPREVVPLERLVGRAAFGFKGDGVTGFVGGYAERVRHAAKRIPV